MCFCTKYISKLTNTTFSHLMYISNSFNFPIFWFLHPSPNTNMNQPEVEDSNTSSGSKRGKEGQKRSHFLPKEQIIKRFCSLSSLQGKYNMSFSYIPTDVIDTFMQNFLWCGQHYVLKIEKRIYKLCIYLIYTSGYVLVI